MNTLKIKPVSVGGFHYLRVTGVDAAGKKVRVMARTEGGAKAIVEYCAPGGWTVAGVHALQGADAAAQVRAGMN
jgi:hypothetical protein